MIHMPVFNRYIHTTLQFQKTHKITFIKGQVKKVHDV